MLLSGCATLFGDKDKHIRVESNPPGANVFLNGMPYGKTPTVVTITNMLGSNLLTFRMDGYDEISRPVMTSIQPIAFLNLVNIVCWGIDFATGNIYRLDNKMIMVDLDKKTATIKAEDGNYVVDLTKQHQHCEKT